ncbi:glycosyltransferase [Coleofasciculus chthonoplastes]|uniref:glycosyltransferase n=1 Tax=Coleofasciculus chthonoplastes TaxID=64178 RepID=UPI0033015257
MRILIAHNYYQQPGGEDQVFAIEVTLLESYGHQVVRYTLDNDQIQGMNPLELAKKTVWNSQVYQELRSLIRQEQPQIAHFHNTFPLISPAAYYAAKDEGIPVIQTLHNYRLLCPNATFFREGRICEDCMGQLIPIPGVIHACYRESRTATATVTMMLTTHRAVGTWVNCLDTYIALTEFARQKFIQGGLPAEKIVVKPNFVHPDPGLGEGRGNYALFVGRLSPEKGLDTLLQAWKKLGSKIPLKIVGDGSLTSQVSQAVAQISGVEYLGRKPIAEIYRLMGEAAFLVFPSEWYEGQPRTILESFAVGTPVIASNLGAMSSLINPYHTGLHFRPGDSEDLTAQVEWVLSHPTELTQMRQEARAEFEAKYTATENYRRLMDIYQKAMDSR